MTPKEFGKSMRVARKAKNITQLFLAKQIGVKAATICRYETGVIEPSITIAIKIADVLNVSLDELAGIKPRKSRASDAASDLEARLAEMERRLSALETKT